MMKGKKKYIILAVLVLVLIGAGYLNYRLSAGNNNMADAVVNDGTNAAQSTNAAALKSGEVELPVMSTGDYFTDYKQNRESVRNKEISYLDSIIDDDKSDQATLKEAQAQKMEIVNSMEKELTIEGLLNAKGFTDAIVTVQKGNINIVIKEKQISDQQAVQILDIVQKQTNEAAKNIKIILQG
jgi:stage III sporulation protein AH